ncbi:macro domain containing protein [Entamoeba histolytica HM-1:IMSS-B]|uniref:Macro domain-containing protein n=6 Tax=Entamoeba histolytica TaxID=5759 RepID=C4M2I9_ENTH1|nr:hypothetical protein, conserved [Entamoeba histolytica HM-1:IMSS]EMD45728.1 phosphatase the Cterminal family of histone macroH2A1, putative [Entamoeba histolytica KU27]EMH74117.1 macro domain containing protein [Entamoeba histolytica HM-1:IMSS-B]EMS15399.1 phosphatase family protein [Entamoeba histolytica HM-3:IMSS]ENY62166.1 phosphatase the C-terminal domain of histone macroH2A1 family protein [Entamoeba histolytica HM-1:IMSS-A]GAT95494.1 hypothetical protein conserved [Entamoeba histolyti|eukprot:XP_652066.1 hypothetical protein, conserved [Entamoeba histolytica HM-1:IMSS]
MEETVEWLINSLKEIMKKECTGKRFIENFIMPKTYSAKRILLRRMTDTIKPLKYSPLFIQKQNELLQSELGEIIDYKSLPIHPNLNKQFSKSIRVWKGDITKLKIDSIVNAANNTLVGCFIPLHSCVDSIIHERAGVQLRHECSQLKTAYKATTTTTEITKGYNLPAKYVIHVVGPIVDTLKPKHSYLLQQCYLNCLNKAIKAGCTSIGFCCISTGMFGFPNEEAAKIAIQTVNNFLKNHQIEVVFCVFKEIDYNIYTSLLNDGFNHFDIINKECYDKECLKEKEQKQLQKLQRLKELQLKKSSVNEELTENELEEFFDLVQSVPKEKRPKQPYTLDKWFSTKKVNKK